MIDGDDYGAISGMNKWQEKPKHLEKACPSVALSTAHPTWLGPRSNPNHRVGSRGLTAWAKFDTSVALPLVEQTALTYTGQEMDEPHSDHERRTFFPLLEQKKLRGL
jgi:hypothetical protein